MLDDTMNPVEKPIPKRLADQIDWYDRRASKSRTIFQGLTALQILIASALPIIALLRVTRTDIIAGVSGAVLVAIEGFQQMGQYHEHWLRYRNTCEALRRERSLYEASAGSYAGAENPLAMLVERTEAIMAAEGANWSEIQQKSAISKAKA
jgi:hypothetical protein